MTSRSLFVVAAMLALTACGGDASDPTADTAGEPSSSSAPSTDPVAPTSAPVDEALVIRGDGLGAVMIGDRVASVVDEITGEFGPPSDDTGWQDTAVLGSMCPGSTVRVVTWGDGLSLVFSDSSPVVSGARHFAGYTYAASATMSPAGLVTDGGVGLGSTLRQLTAAHPDTDVRAEDVFGLSAEIPGGILVRLSGTGEDSSVVSFSVGATCGE